MAFAYNHPNWIELRPGDDFVSPGGHSSYGTVALWTEAERNKAGIGEIVEADPPPAGKVVIKSEIIDQAGVPVRLLTFADAPAPRPPESISDRQFAQQLAILGTITEAEAIAWAAKGDLPEVLRTAVASLPDDGTRFAAEMMLSSATTYERSHPMTATLGALLWYEDADLAAIWKAASLL